MLRTGKPLSGFELPEYDSPVLEEITQENRERDRRENKTYSLLKVNTVIAIVGVITAIAGLLVATIGLLLSLGLWQLK